METKNEVINKMDTLAKNAKEAGIAIKNLERAMGIFCEKVNMDMDEFKQQMVLKALKDGAEGKGRDYIGNLDADAAEVIEKLIKERDEARKCAERAEGYLKDARLRMDDYITRERNHKSKVEMAFAAVKRTEYITIPLLDKRKYSRKDVVTMIGNLIDDYDKQLDIIKDLLTNDMNSEPKKTSPIRFA